MTAQSNYVPEKETETNNKGSKQWKQRSKINQDIWPPGGKRQHDLNTWQVETLGKTKGLLGRRGTIHRTPPRKKALRGKRTIRKCQCERSQRRDTRRKSSLLEQGMRPQ